MLFLCKFTTFSSHFHYPYSIKNVQKKGFPFILPIFLSSSFPFYRIYCYFCIRMKDEKTLQRVTSSFMQGLCEQQEGWRWAGEDLLIIPHLGEESSKVFGSGSPFQLDQLHIGIVLEGEQDVIVNLHRHHLTKGCVLVASPESVMQQDGRSNDFDMQVIHLSDTLLHNLFGDQVPALFAHRMRSTLFASDADDGQSVSLSPTEHELLLTMTDALWQTVHTGFNASRDHLLTAILSLIDDLSKSREQGEMSHQPRNVMIFNRFLSLAFEHCDRWRTLDFYADRLCLSKQYLGSIILEASHRSAREWIDEATISRIKVMLLYSTASLSNISERMSFAEPSHFSRYFKRLTGLTPSEYRNGK